MMQEAPSSSSSGRLLLAFCTIFLISLALRVLPTSMWTQVHDEKHGEFYYWDSFDYDRLAWDVTTGQGYTFEGRPTSFRAPGLPYLLAGIYKLCGHRVDIARLVILCLGVLIPLLIFIISYRCHGMSIAFIAGLLAACTPGLIFYSHFVLTEIPCTFFLLLSYLFLFTGDCHKSRNVVWGAFFLGITNLFRAFFVLLPLFIIPYYLFQKDPSTNWKTKLRKSFLLVFIMGLTMSPWVIRNAMVHKTLVPVSTQSGTVLHLSYRPPGGKLGEGFVGDEELLNPIDRQSMTEVEYSKAVTKDIVGWIRTHPKEVVKLEILKCLWFIYPFEGRRYNITTFDPVFSLVFMMFLVGVFVCHKVVVPIRPSILFVFYAFFFSMIFYASPRFRVPILPYMIFPAASVLVHFWRSWDTTKSKVLTSGVLFLIFCGLAFGSWIVKVI